MQILRIYPSSINDRFIDQAAEVLRSGGVIVYPTDSLYALACDALNSGAIRRVCQIKGLNPQKNSLSIVCSDISQAAEYAKIDNAAYAVLREFTPGPFTFILPAATTLPKAFKGRKEVGVRIPDNPISRRLAEELGNPLLSTSLPVGDMTEEAICSEEEIALLAERLDVDLMIDGGAGDCRETTVVDLKDSGSPEIVREGKGALE